MYFLVSFFRRYSFFVFLFLIFSCLFTTSEAQSKKIVSKQASGFNQQGAYFTVSMNYARNLANADTSDIRIPTMSDTIQYKNTGSTNGPAIGLEAGYQWRLASHWLWSLGGRFNYYELMQNGNARLLDSPLDSYSYQYNINIKLANVVAKLIYRVGKWQYYVELNSGLGIVNADDYVSKQTGQNEFYNAKTKNNWSYGVALGTSLRLSKQTSIGFNIGYTDLGKAELGARQLVASTGQISQHIKLLNTGINVTHWF